ncbi:MAG: hypothetical protein K6F67_03985 [Oscillospiraceae bacterium]|nr:hypothetical protein [Oscillospiraceae bacterium]
MTPEAQKKFDEKMARVIAARTLKEPDRVPITPSAALFLVFNAGYTVAEVVYDETLEKHRKALIKYLNEFDPDNNPGMANIDAGQGKMLEIQNPKTMRWAGMPGNIIDENSLQQYVEFPILLDDEFDEFNSDRTGWTLRKAIPRTSGLLEPLGKMNISTSAPMVAAEFSKPEVRRMIEDLWKLHDMQVEYNKRVQAIIKETNEMGYPSLTGGVGAGAPFDQYSNFLRGTLLSLSDLYDRPEEVLKYVEPVFEASIARIRAAKGKFDGKHVFMALHKGMDGFMSQEHYRDFYWKYLQKVICEIIDAGMVPYVFTEGKYNTRLDFLTEVPPGKVIYHFEDVDMAMAKKKLGNIACITGGFPTSLLDWGTTQQVIDETKRLIDICAPGGGFIFETGCGMCNAKRENVVAMFETVKEYGQYK